MRFALITLAESEYWQSCHYATLGLKSAYFEAFDSSFIEYPLSKFCDPSYLRELAEEIVSSNCGSVVFIDSSPLFGRLLAALHQTGYAGAFRFHVFGDVVRRSSEWLSYTPFLKGHVVEWVCASERQQRLVNSLLPVGSSLTWVCPFPVFQRDFAFSERLREEKLKQLGFQRDEFVILYTGRMTLQKNVIALLKAFALLPASLQKKARLVFAGDFDDLCAPFTGLHFSAGSFFSLWQKEFGDLPADTKKRIHILPGVSRKDLRSLYSAADLFVSLSLQHDEDFGMAPVEAATSGLPLVLTSWGGYANFSSRSSFVKMIPVTLSEQGPSFELSTVSQSICDIAVAEKARRRSFLPEVGEFTVQKVAELLRTHRVSQNSHARFTDFDARMSALSALFDSAANLVVFSELGENSVYEQVYRNYCDEK